MVSALRDILGRSTASQNPGQFDEKEERAFAGIGYNADADRSSFNKI